MVLLFDAYTDHNANTSHAPWGAKYLSTDKEVKFGNKSESDMFQGNQKILIHFCMNQREDAAWIFLVIEQEVRLVGLVRKLMEYGHQVFDILNSSLMVVLFLHIKIMWIVKVERSIKRPCGFIILSSSNFSIPSTKTFETSILSMITILCLLVTSTTMRIRNIQTSMKTCLDLSICGWVRGFSLTCLDLSICGFGDRIWFHSM